MNETENVTGSGRHPVSVGHLVMGIAFLGLVGIWALIQSDAVNNGDIRWLLPIPWVFAGVAGLLATTLTARNRHANRQTGWVGNNAASGDSDLSGDSSGDPSGDTSGDTEA